MPANHVNYRPPETDSEEEYDGFCFGEKIIKKDYRSHWVVDLDEELYSAVYSGDLEKVKQQIQALKFDVNEPIKGCYTLLQHACKEGHFEIVDYLLTEKHANPNKQVDSLTPLMMACDCSKESHIVEKIVKLLLKHDVAINISDKYGTTPFMNACIHGHIGVVQLLMKHVSFDAVDNQGCTAIFHAVEHNKVEILKLLIAAGVNSNIPNSKGYTPRQVAQFHGFNDLLELLPAEREEYTMPTTFCTYNTLGDLIPRIFLKPNSPEYFQEIHSILREDGLENFVHYFAKDYISLQEFLCMDAELLEQKVDIDMPIYRMKILKCLLKFHLNHWSAKTIARVQHNTSQLDFYEILTKAANHLQNLVVIKSTLRYIDHNIRADIMGEVTLEQIQAMQRNLKAYRGTINDLTNTTKYLASFSPPKNPLHIDYDEIVAERKRSKLKRYLKYTTLLVGISVYFCIKFNKNIKLPTFIF